MAVDPVSAAARVKAPAIVLMVFAVLGLLTFNDLNAHLGEIGHHVFDLLGRILVRRKDGVQFIERDVTTLLALGDQALDGSRLHIEQIGFGVLFSGSGLGSGWLGCHRSAVSVEILVCAWRSGSKVSHRHLDRHPNRRAQPGGGIAPF